MAAKITFAAPVSGIIYPLERVPDPVFAQKLVGDGISIDPTDSHVVAPCAGEVMHVHPSGHAVTVRDEQGIEILIHVGIDTVALRGEGFSPRVQAGEKVQAGTTLIEVDLDYVATHARSLLTQIVISNGDRVKNLDKNAGIAKAGETTIFSVELNDSFVGSDVRASTTVTSEAILVPNPTGIHARPAAVLTSVAKKYKGDIKVHLGERAANARSVTSLLALEVAQGDKVIISANGPDAKEAVAILADLIAKGLGDEGCVPAPSPATTVVDKLAAPIARRRSTDPKIVEGVSASPGLAVGPVFQLKRFEILVEEAGAGVELEQRRLSEAIEKGRGQLEALRAQLHAQADPAKAAIFAAHSELLDDPDFIEIAQSLIGKGKSAAFAWKNATEVHANRLAALRNELLAQRASDVRDVGNRVLGILTGVTKMTDQYPAGSILIAEDITPSDAASMERGRVAGFATLRGGATSHVAILARSLEIPAVAGVEPRALEIANGVQVILDGTKGTLRPDPTAEEIAKIREGQRRYELKREQNIASAHEPAVTVDGHRVGVFANVGGVRDAQEVTAIGGEGIGLLRSEFLFMERSTAPDENEQAESYTAVLKAVGGAYPVIIRTLDVGGDKPLQYLPIPREDNPFLGERGVRVGLDRPDILRTQLRALLRSANHGRLQVMFPMVSTIDELRDAKAILLEEAGALGVAPVPCGIMVEVPATAVMAETFATEADFLSIGTNDLTQYTLAMDRGHPKLAPKVDALNPAVLQLIAQTVAGAHAHGRHVGVCGGIAGDAVAIPILVGLGVDELSVSLPAIPAVKARIRTLNHQRCRELAERALSCATATQVRALIPESED